MTLKLGLRRALVAAGVSILACISLAHSQASPAKPGPAQYSNEPCDGEYMILYDAKQHPITMAQLLKTLKQQTSYPCSISEWHGLMHTIPIVRVETTMPIMVMDDHGKVVVDEMDFFAQDKNLSPSEVKFIKSCNARLQVSGAGNPNLKKLPNGDLLVEDAQFAPHAKDTTEVVNALMKAVDGIASCTTDGSWMHK